MSKINFAPKSQSREVLDNYQQDADNIWNVSDEAKEEIAFYQKFGEASADIVDRYKQSKEVPKNHMEYGEVDMFAESSKYGFNKGMGDEAESWSGRKARETIEAWRKSNEARRKAKEASIDKDKANPDTATFKLDINPTAKEAAKPVEEAKNAEVKKEYTEEQKEGLIKLAKLRLEFAAEGKDMDFAKAREFYDRYHQIAYVSDLSDHAGTITGFKPFMDKYRELSGQSKGQGFEEVEDQTVKSPEEAKKAPETEKSKEKKESRWKKLGKAVAGLAIFATLAGVFGRSHNQQEEVKPEGQKTTLVAKPAAESGKEGADSNGEEKDGGFEMVRKGPEARESLRDGKYDKSADPYFAQHPKVEDLFSRDEVKESAESLGLDLSKKSNEEYKSTILSEDNPSIIQEILMTDAGLMESVGISYEQAEKLFDDYRNGDATAYQLVAELRQKIAETIQVEDGRSLEGVTFNSVYLSDVNGDGSDLNFSYANSLNLGGTTRIIKFTINGVEYVKELRDQCGGQLILSDGTVIELPPQIQEIPEPTPPPTPKLVPYVRVPKTPTPEQPNNPGGDTPETPTPEDPKTPETPKKKDPKVDINVNSNLNDLAKSKVTDNTTDTTEGNKFEESPQDAGGNMIYGGTQVEKQYQAPPVTNFKEQDRSENTIDDNSVEEPEEILSGTSSVNPNTGESNLDSSEQNTGAIVDATDKTYTVESGNGTTVDGVQDVDISDPNKTESLNGVTDVDGPGSNSGTVDSSF